MADGLGAKVRVLDRDVGLDVIALGAIAIAGAYFYRDSIRQALDSTWKSVFPEKKEPLHPLAVRDLATSFTMAPGDIVTALVISGTVVDQQSGSPAAGAFVWIREKLTTNEFGIATTALDGKFTGSINALGSTKAEMAGVAREVQARKAGFENSTWFDVPTPDIANGHLRVEGMVDGFTGNSLFYTVKDARGFPARGARIHLLRNGKEVSSARCDANGRGEIRVAVPGTYDLFASSANILSQKMKVKFAPSSANPPVLHGYIAAGRQVI